MRVLLVNTSEHTGGAAIAASRLRDALGNNGVKATMLVGHKDSELITVADPHEERRLRYNFIGERLAILRANRFHKYRLFETDAASYGIDITGLREFREADIIHLHWINQGFLSLSGIRRILASGKPVVWTLHDMWPFTGICHYAGDCDKYKDSCGRCPKLWGGGSSRDLSHRVYLKKKELYAHSHLTFVACSEWLASVARESTLMEGKEIRVIPNPINTRLFAPAAKGAARSRLALPQSKILLLFTAFRVTSKIKGIDYLVEAVTKLAKEHPDIVSNMSVVAVGKDSETLRSLLPVKVYPMGYVESESRMRDIYNACNLLLMPTLQDNLPNTVMEAMASGVPCVAFGVGGIPEMIDHLKSGYIAAPRDAADFAAGIIYSLRPDIYPTLSSGARAKVTSSYSDSVIARRFSDLYLSLLGGKDS